MATFQIHDVELSQAEILTKLCAGMAEINGGEMLGKMAVVLQVPDERAEQLEEAARRVELTVERMDLDADFT